MKSTLLRAVLHVSCFPRRADWWRFWLTMLGVVVLLGSLHNSYWIRSGDGEAYLGIARELWLGRGYRHNGNPVGLVPPLWPATIAAGMFISDSFLLLKLLPMGFVALGLACWFWIITRLSNSVVAIIIVLTTATLNQVFPLAITFHSDGMFFFLTAASMLLALRARESPRATASGTLLCLSSIAAVAVRWNGVPAWLHAAAILATNETRPRFNRRWILIFVSGALTLATFFMLRWWLRVPDSTIDFRYDPSLAKSYDILNIPQNLGEYLDRAANLARWPAGCLWYDFVLYGGWIIVAAVLWRTWRDVIRRGSGREWIWPSMIVHMLFVTAIWPKAVPRYVLPLAPLFMLAIVRTIDDLVAMASVRTKETGWGKALRIAVLAIFFGSIWIVNVPHYITEVRVMRGDVNRLVHGGLYAEMAAMANTLRRQRPRGEIAITRAHIGALAQVRFTNINLRALNLLLDQPIMSPPDELCVPQPPDAAMHAWCRAAGVRYYVDLARVRVNVHDMPRGNPNRNEWRLYRVTPRGFERIATPVMGTLPREVPHVPPRVSPPPGTPGGG